MPNFSQRHGIKPAPSPIVVREDAPPEMRGALIQIAAEEGFEPPSKLRKIVCRVMRKLPDSNNWSERPNIEGEAHHLIMVECPWYRVYDLAEAMYAELKTSSRGPVEFERKLNEVLVEQGVGWKMVHGQMETRGDLPFEQTLQAAKKALVATSRTTAAGEIAEALHDLSRRPEPDVTGAIQHAMAAMECVARDLCGDPKPTLGEVMKKYKKQLQIPAPLDSAVEKAWGYASEVGRHLREGREPTRVEAELVVSLCAAVITYLSQPVSSGVDELEDLF